MLGAHIPLISVNHILTKNSAEQSAVLSGHTETSDIACVLDNSSIINMRETKEKLPSQNIPRKQDRIFS